MKELKYVRISLVQLNESEVLINVKLGLVLLCAPSSWEDLGIKATQRKCAGRRKGKGGKSWQGFRYQWEEQSWMQSQCRRGRRTEEQDPWSAAETPSVCVAHFPALCYSSAQTACSIGQDQASATQGMKDP